jgi:predicted ATP-grasp superfamily ATP-dependent carboligase
LLRIAVWEYVTGGGLMGSPVSPSLMAEAQMIAGQLVADLAILPEVSVVIAAVPPFAPPKATEIVAIGPGNDPTAIWRGLIAGADIVWPVAPETDGALHDAAAFARRLCSLVLISDHETLAITSSKRRTAEHLTGYGIATVPTYLAGTPLPHAAHGWVIKPDDGAGADETYRSTKPPAGGGKLVVQPFIPGPALSLSLLARDGEAWLLSCNHQDVVLEDDRFAYRGFVVGGAEDRRAALEPIAHAVIASLPGLWGYIGIDLIDGEDGPVVLEINPRLTTSYAGLHEALGLNPAQLVLDLIDRPISALRRRVSPRPVRITVPS